jgi:YVTN family beta-propeller protein
MINNMSAAIVLFLLATSAWAAERPYLAIVEKVAGAVGFYSEGGKQLGLVKVGPFPHEAVLSKDGSLLYVSDNGVLWMTEDSLGYNVISVVDVQAMKKLHDIDLGRFHRPHGIALVGDRLLATTERPFGLVMVDPAARKVVRDFDVKGKSPHMVIPAAGGKRVFVSNTDSDSLAVIDLATGETKIIPTGAHPQGGVVSHDGKRLYLTNTNGNQISVFDTDSLRVTGTIATGKGPARIALTPDGKTLVYNLQFEPAVGFADVASGKQTAQVALSGRPLSLTMMRDGRRAFAGIQDQDKVAFISVAARKIERVIELPKGSGPDPAIPLE